MGSASKRRAVDFSTFVLGLSYEMPILEHLRPYEGQCFSKESFGVGSALPNRAPGVQPVCITGQLAGSCANVMVTNDIEVLNNSATLGMGNKLSQQIEELDAIIVLGMLLSNDQLAESGRIQPIWTACDPHPKTVENKYGDKLASMIAKAVAKHSSLVGHATESAGFSDEDLQERESSDDWGGFLVQLMLDASLGDMNRYPLKLTDLIITDVDKKVAPIGLACTCGPDQRLKEVPFVGVSGDRYYGPMWVSDERTEYAVSPTTLSPAGWGEDEMRFAIINDLHGGHFLFNL